MSITLEAKETAAKLKRAGYGDVVDAALRGGIEFAGSELLSGAMADRMGMSRTNAKSRLSAARIVARGDGHYIDRDAFNRLVVNNVDGRYNRKIAEGIFKIAQGVGKRFARYRYKHDLEDAISDAVLTAIIKIQEFDRRRTRASAFSYFTSIVRHRINESLDAARAHAKKMRSYAEITDSVGSPIPKPRLEPGKKLRRRRR